MSVVNQECVHKIQKKKIKLASDQDNLDIKNQSQLHKIEKQNHDTRLLQSVLCANESHNEDEQDVARNDCAD